MRMTRPLTPLLLLLLFSLSSCEDDVITPAVSLEVPATYSFDRNGQSTVNFSGQTTRIAMSEEFVAALSNPENTQMTLENMFRNAGPNGEDVAPFATDELNASEKSVRSKVAASVDYFSADAAGSAAVRADFDDLIAAQATTVFPRWMELAAPGEAGQVATGTQTRYVNGKGLELNQAVAKSLLGALMLDQALNNYLSPAVLDAGQNRAENEAGITVAGTSYTDMEHTWDEAYGYLFGQSTDPADPLATLGEDDQFLNEYLGQVNKDPDFTGIAEEVFRAFVRGRAAIVAGAYDVRDEQAAIIQRALSRVVAIRGTFYLSRGATATETEAVRGPGFHALSEAYGFVYSLQFSHDPATGAPYFSRQETRDLLNQLTASSENGLWDVEVASIRGIGTTIADRLDFSYAHATN